MTLGATLSRCSCGWMCSTCSTIANFGPPGNVVGSPTFGKITRTRLPTGEAGSSRQIQLAVKLSF